MELRRYWTIVMRRLPVALAVPLLVGLGSLALLLVRPASYTATAKVQLVLVPQQADNPDLFRYADYYNFLATEYTVDDVTEIMNGNVFRDDLARLLQSPEYNLKIEQEQLDGALRVSRKHRVLMITVTAGNRDWAKAIADGATKIVQRDPVKYFSRGGSPVKEDAALLVIERPLEAQGNRSTAIMNVALQTLLGLFAGLGLAFLLEYLDDRLRGAEAVCEALALPVLGEIPATVNGRRTWTARAWRQGV